MKRTERELRCYKNLKRLTGRRLRVRRPPLSQNIVVTEQFSVLRVL